MVSKNIVFKYLYILILVLTKYEKFHVNISSISYKNWKINKLETTQLLENIRDYDVFYNSLNFKYLYIYKKNSDNINCAFWYFNIVFHIFNCIQYQKCTFPYYCKYSIYY